MSEITIRQVMDLRDEAAAAGDIAQRIICDLAIDGRDSSYDPDCLDADGFPDYSGGGHDGRELLSIMVALRMTREAAMVECARVIGAAAAEGGAS